MKLFRIFDIFMELLKEAKDKTWVFCLEKAGEK